MFVNLFLSMLIFSIISTMTMGSYFLMWVFIETTVFFTIPVMAKSSRSSFNTESLVIYFIYQAISSILIITGIVQGMGDYYSILMALGILIKLGVFPFHVWVLPVLKGCSLSMFFLLLIPIKLPIYFLSEYFVKNYLVCVVGTLVVGISLALNQTSLLGVIASSSISSTGVLLTSLNLDMFSLYFFGYFLSIASLLYSLSCYNQTILFSSILALLGLPLLPLFIPKLMLLVSSISSFPFLAAFILFSFMISSLYYVKFLPSSMMSVDVKGMSVSFGLVLCSMLPLL